MLGREMPSLLRRKLPSLLGGMEEGRGSLEMDGLTPSFALNFAEGGSIVSQAAAATFTRATTATVVDQDSVVRTALSGEARMQGLRRVRNVITASEDLAGASWVDPVGGTSTRTNVSAPSPYTGTFCRSNNTSGNGGFRQVFNSPKATTRYLFSVVLQSVDATSINIRLENGGATYGSASSTTYTITTTPQKFLFDLGVSGAAPTVANIEVKNQTGGVTSFLMGIPQLEEVNGQAVQNPAEYVSVGVLSAPYQGANVDGVKYFPTHNGNVVQQNLLTFSQDFSNAVWAKGFGQTVVADNTTDPNGTTTADKWTAGNAGFGGLIRTSFALVALQTYTLSIYVKKGNHRYIGMRLSANDYDGADRYNFIDLDTGIIDNSKSPTGIMTAAQLPNGWWRLTKTFTMLTAPSTTVDTAIVDSTGYVGWTPTGTEFVYVWGAQLQIGRRASTYVVTTAAAVNNNIVEEGASDYIASTTRLGYLAEGARTNLCLQSEVLGTTWTTSNSSITSNAIVAPDGNTTADKVVENAVAAVAHLVQQGSIPVAANGTLSYSVYAKAAERTRGRIYVWDGIADGFFADFNLTAGTITAGSLTGAGTITSAAIVALTNGWYRLNIVGKINATATTGVIINYLEDGAGSAAYNGDGTSGLYYWGAQLEQASFPSSYIPTTTVAVTRNSDMLTYPTAGWYNLIQGTSLVKYTRISASGVGAYALQQAASPTNNRIDYRVSTATSIVTDTGVAQAAIFGIATAIGVLGKAATACQVNDFAISIDGAAVVTDTVGTMPSIIDRLLIADIDAPGGNPMFGTCAGYSYYPYRLTNAQLQRLTR